MALPRVPTVSRRQGAARVRGFWLWLVLTLLSGGIGAVYSIVLDGTMSIAIAIGLVIGGSITAFEILVVQSPLGIRFRRLPLPIFICALSLVWVVMIWGALTFVPRAFPQYDSTRFLLVSGMARDMGFSFIVALVLNALIRVQSLIGPRVFWNFLIGRYYRPLREDRVFLFLDLAGSTRMAEELGDIETQTLIAQFFFDIARPIAIHGGETHRYIGDEIVVTWPMDLAIKDARCLRCVEAIRDLLRARASYYHHRFGTVPEYRIGLHGGTVVASEVGDDKREIVYFGDTINTAARLQGLAKERGVDVVVSEFLLERIGNHDGLAVQALEPAMLAGKSAPIGVATLTRS